MGVNYQAIPIERIRYFYDFETPSTMNICEEITFVNNKRKNVRCY